MIVPIAMQRFMLLQRNHVYTAITRGKRMVLLVGQRKAVGVAISNNRTSQRLSGFVSPLREFATSTPSPAEFDLLGGGMIIRDGGVTSRLFEDTAHP